MRSLGYHLALRLALPLLLGIVGSFVIWTLVSEAPVGLLVTRLLEPDGRGTALLILSAPAIPIVLFFFALASSLEWGFAPIHAKGVIAGYVKYSLVCFAAFLVAFALLWTLFFHHKAEDGSGAAVAFGMLLRIAVCYFFAVFVGVWPAVWVQSVLDRNYVHRNVAKTRGAAPDEPDKADGTVTGRRGRIV